MPKGNGGVFGMLSKHQYHQFDVQGGQDEGEACVFLVAVHSILHTETIALDGGFSSIRTSFNEFATL